jgi:UDP-N-acetylglucosamine 1-carboxyvinyltransferase
MNRYKVTGGKRLDGTIKCQGAKNSVLPILAASILNLGKSKVFNCPNLRDVEIMIEILRNTGCDIKVNSGTIEVDSSNISKFEISEKLMRQMRSSIILMGPMLANSKDLIISYPGGCDLGPRPIDMHINGLRKLGAKIVESRGYIYCSAKKLKGAEIYFDFPSVGATENVMCAAVLAEGATYIKNAAREPEIVDLQNFLNKMGAKIIGAGTNIIKIEGVKKLKDVEHTVIQDRIAAGTYMAAAAITGGQIVIEDVIHGDMDSFLGKFKEMGCMVETFSDRIKIEAPKKLKAIDKIRTAPYPGFPTDMQQQFMTMLSVAQGTSLIVETIFENRYRHVNELMRMGASISVDGRVAVVQGVDNLSGATVTSTDLRGGASLILAGLAANGQTLIEDNMHIERGYCGIENVLTTLGAVIEKL